ncbi:hypothetical protein SELMODRAFT_431306 [Selaginella moellendorffii]|uniref:Creatinase N-terminal domain-containing protein n=1 Tax=Selaginella moellendorffii TaxID=88036 RepID=D8TC63_SELML|nr:hypothetical protein SELMODRAFT_431306 [Selaginella moellendorffii]
MVRRSSDWRPCPPRVYNLIYTGVDVATKFSDARKKLSAAGATGIVITMLNEVAWLFNVHAGNFPHLQWRVVPKYTPSIIQGNLKGCCQIPHNLQSYMELVTVSNSRNITDLQRCLTRQELGSGEAVPLQEEHIKTQSKGWGLGATSKIPSPEKYMTLMTYSLDQTAYIVPRVLSDGNRLNRMVSQLVQWNGLCVHFQSERAIRNSHGFRYGRLGRKAYVGRPSSNGPCWSFWFTNTVKKRRILKLLLITQLVLTV